MNIFLRTAKVSTKSSDEGQILSHSYLESRKLILSDPAKKTMSWKLIPQTWFCILLPHFYEQQDVEIMMDRLVDK